MCWLRWFLASPWIFAVPMLWSTCIILSLSAAEASQSFAAGIDVPPVIDLSNPNDDQLAQEIAHACSTFGFFQVTSHGIADDLVKRVRMQCEQFFDLPLATKKQIRRNSYNSRGFFDDELTQQRRDWKECLDIGVPGSGQWDVSDDSPANGCLDGFNQFPIELPEFRETMVEYFEACAELSHRLACLMARGMGLAEDDPLIQDLRQQHTSFMRCNYYPPCLEDTKLDPPMDMDNDENNPSPLGISPHKDAGFLTILLQDDNCHSLQASVDGKFISVPPVPGALTINTGDMAQVWSNGNYKAPLHRVLTHGAHKRYSIPFFYNPGYDWLVQPTLQYDDLDTPNYFGIVWGYFRALRYAGDLADLGVEIQIANFETQRQPPSAHLLRQKHFQEGRWSSFPFDIDRYRMLVQEYPDE